MSENTSTALAIPQVASLRKIEPAQWNALKEIYDGASDEKVALVVDYCRARKLDPLKKPVHIVPVYSHRRKQMVETIWPSISEVRTTAMRTQAFAGQEETKFGETRKARVGSVELEFPDWAQVTVYRLIQGQRCTFPGPRVYWLEAYGQMGKDATPNAMWQKRSWGQLEKCAEAAALRRAFPEEVGSEATAEEMAGRAIHDEGGMTAVSVDASGEENAPEQEQKKRATVPKKNKGAAAMSTGPIVETEVVETPATPPPQPADGEPVVEAEASPVAEKKALEAKPDPAPVAKPAPAAEGKKMKMDATPSEWPKTVTCTIDEVVSAPVRGNPKFTSVKVARLGNGDLTVAGVKKSVSEIGRVIFDPDRPELDAFAKVGDERVEIVIDQQPSATDPNRKNLIIVRASVADVEM